MSGETNGFEIGDEAPALELPDTGGEVHTLGAPGERAASLVIWTSNHCPYAIAWHDRLMDVARDYADRNVAVLAVNSNDAESYPADALEPMADRVAAGEFACPYLHDESQEAARAWGAKTTPDVYVLDADLHLRYRGAPDADPSQQAAWVRGVLEALLAGEEPERTKTDSVGCGVKWR